MGIVNAVGGKTLIDLIGDITPFGGFDAVLVEGLINDQGQSAVAVTSGTTALWQAMLTAFPGTPLFDIGSFRAPSKDPGATLAAAEKAAALAVFAGQSRCVHLDAYGAGFQTIATAANYAADSLHLSDAGADELGRTKIAAAMAAALETML
jgi:hypothetical protein